MPRRSRSAVCMLLLVVMTEVFVAPAALPNDHTHETARHSLRAPLTRDSFYFVMVDRFANGSSDNDRGGLDGDRLVTGFDPAHKGFYHGGDLAGLRSKLGYIQGLGVTAIWLTPVFANRPVQGDPNHPETVSAGYHGYWITDFTRVDPHLGSNQELQGLVDAAHARGIKVFFDIITNHTANVIDYRQRRYDYVPKVEAPYRDATGSAFDDRAFAGMDRFPALDPLKSFPYTPFFHTDADAQAKQPSWLNDPMMYHNRGDSTFAGESSTYGDFFGLDDLFTERPEVVRGMTDIYKRWISDFGIDGFRIDTVKHVNTEFWKAFAPEVLAHARAAGKRRFFMFGEVFDTSKPFLSSFTTNARLQSVLDFGFQRAAQDFAASSTGTDRLRDFFADDDLFTDADSNAYQLLTFLGNHDMGRIGRFIATDPANAGAPESELEARDRLAHELMYLSRGNPVVYYGDEQGLTGDGGDQDARQDMFGSRVASYNDDDLIGTDRTTAQDSFNRRHPLYQAIRSLAALTRRHPALRDGAQQHRFSTNGPGIYAFSRVDARQQVEYVVALNNARAPKTARIPTYSANQRFDRLYGGSRRHLRSAADGALALTMPPLSAVVYQARAPMPRSQVAPRATIEASAPVRDRFEVGANARGAGFYEVAFEMRTGSSGNWARIGTDDNAPYRVYPDVSGLPPGTPLQIRAIVWDNTGHKSLTQSIALTTEQ